MKIVKKIVLGLLGILCIVGLVGILLPGDVHVERSTQINAPTEKVFTLVANLHNWPQWSPWHRRDPKLKPEYFGPETGPGAGCSWASEKVGNGKVTVTEYELNSKINTQIEFTANRSGKAAFIFTPTPQGTQVTWTMDSNLKQGDFPANIIGSLFKGIFKIYVRNDYEMGLANLKATAEKM